MFEEYKWFDFITANRIVESTRIHVRQECLLPWRYLDTIPSWFVLTNWQLGFAITGFANSIDITPSIYLGSCKDYVDIKARLNMFTIASLFNLVLSTYRISFTGINLYVIKTMQESIYIYIYIYINEASLTPMNAYHLTFIWFIKRLVVTSISKNVISCDHLGCGWTTMFGYV